MSLAADNLPAGAQSTSNVVPMRRREARPARGWCGALRLTFEHRGSRTVIIDRRHHGPLYLQRPFYPEGDCCHVYLLHPPGGLTAGDELSVDVAARNGANVLLTTPASTKFYRSPATSSMTQWLRVAAGASLEWLPLDTILFGGSHARITTRIDLEQGARFAGWETLTLGRPLSGDRYFSGSLLQRTEIRVDGRPLLLERLHWRDAEDPLLSAAWGLGGFTVTGSLYAYPADAGLLAAARAGLVAAESARRGSLEQGIAAATLAGELLIVRMLARQTSELQRTFESVWATIRPGLLHRNASAPRIWRT